MKMLLYIGIVFVIGLVIIFVGLSMTSRKQPELGLHQGRLLACPTTPNCVCSEWPSKNAFIEPIHYSIAHADAWSGIKQAIVESGGLITLEDGHYLHARFVTPILRFVDDVELRIDMDAHLIHLRSASRVGHSDMGLNRKRLERIRTAFNRQIEGE